MIFLLGRQAMLGQEPPTYFRSMTTACFPVLARVHAMYFPASPLPNTTTSYSSIVCIYLAGYLELIGRLGSGAGISKVRAEIDWRRTRKRVRSSSNQIDVPADDQKLQRLFAA